MRLVLKKYLSTNFTSSKNPKIVAKTKNWHAKEKMLYR